jgi:hypothetical protein
MAHDQDPKMASSFLLPVSIVSPLDLGRLIREGLALDEFLRSAALRQGGEAMKLPKTSRLFDELVEANKLNMLQEADRQNLVLQLTELKKSAPTVHMSFSNDPSPANMRRIIEWLRREIHPQLLVRVGIQPNIGAGCVLRTNSRYFDFSLKQYFAGKRELFISELREKVEERTVEITQ